MALINYFVYNTSIQPVTGFYRVVRWGVCYDANLSGMAWETNEVAVENTTEQNFGASFSDTGSLVPSTYNPTTQAFGIYGVGSSPMLSGTAAAIQAVNFSVQSSALDTTADRLLRYSGTEGAFGIGSTVSPQITDFTADSPPTGAYYCDLATVTGGPETAAFAAAVFVQRTSGNGVIFDVRRIGVGVNHRGWVGIRSTNTGAVAWIDANAFYDSLFTLMDEADSTKRLRFQLSGISNNTTRTLTAPNVDGTIAVLAGVAQTFVNTVNFSGTVSANGAIVTIGTSAAASVYGLGTGATTSGLTKAINIGTAGLLGSTTNIEIGSAVTGALGQTRFNSPTITFGGSVQNLQLNNANLWQRANSPDNIAATTTLTAANLQTVAVRYTGAAAGDLTLPLGTDLDTAFSTVLVNTGLEFSIINTGAATATLLVNTGVTIVGAAAVAAGTSGRFLMRRTTTAATWVCYRLA